MIVANSLPEGWEKALLYLHRNGIVIETEWGEKSIDAPLVLKILNPFAEPRVHLKGCICGFRGLKEYVREVLEGVQDWRVGRDWHYTYHERLFNYIPVFKQDDTELERMAEYQSVNQIEYIISKLRQAPFSRRAIAVTWKPWLDENTDSPPCLIYLWCRVVEGRLVMHVHMRSNDALKASFMNMYAYTELQKYIAERLNVEAGYYLHIADSFHVYERDWKWFKAFIKQIESGESKKYWIPSSKLS